MNERSPFPSADTLWRDINAAWDVEGIPARALRAQDQHGLCLTLLLVMVALGQRGIAVHERALDALRPLIVRWHFEVLVPLRFARRALKETDANLYAQAKQVELALERRLVEELVEVLRGRALWNAEDALARNLELAVDAHGDELPDSTYYAAENLGRLLVKD